MGLIGTPSFLGAVPMRRPAYRPAYAPRPRLAQGSPWIEVRPEIKIESPKIAPVINLELGGLPLSLGLFAGSGLVFLLRPQLPEGWPKTVALVAGAGLAVAGITNLVLPKAKAAEAKPSTPQGLPGGAPLPAPAAPGEAGPAGPQSYSASNAMAFGNVTGRIVSPADFSTVNIGWFKKSYPVRVQFLNSAQVPVTFELELTAEEDPSPIGEHASIVHPVQVSLAPGQVKDVDVSMPIADWGKLVLYSNVILTARKRRVPGEEAQLIDMRSFVLK